MALKDRVPFGISLPHRSPDPIPMTAVQQVAQRAEAVGFRDLWVTDNALDAAFSFDSLTILTYDQLLLYVGPLTALAVLIARQATSSARLFAVSALALFGAGLISRTAFRDQFVALGASAQLVHKAWVAAPTLICLVFVASMARGRGEMHPRVMDGSAAARV